MGVVVDLVRARAARLLPAWRAMRPEDLRDVAAVSSACLGGHGLVPASDRLEGCLVLESRGAVVGHLVLGLHRHGAASVVDLCLLPEVRGRGLASLAVGMAASWCSTDGASAMEVAATAGSDGFWSRMRFVSVAGREANGTTRMVRLLPARAARA